MYKQVGVRAVLRSHVGGIPLDPCSCSEGDVAEEETFGEHSCVAEVRQRLAPAAARVDPLVMMAPDTRNRRSWRLESFELLTRQEDEHVRVVLTAVPGAGEE